MNIASSLMFVALALFAGLHYEGWARWAWSVAAILWLVNGCLEWRSRVR